MSKQTEEAPPATPEQAIIRAIHAVMSEVGYVHKSGENDFHKYTYASEADVLSALRPAMIKHGLILIPSVQQVTNIDSFGNTTVSVQYTLAHVSGAVWPQPIMAAGCGGDKNRNGVGDKGVYKAMTGANKYLLFKLFQIETGDEPEDPKGDENRSEKLTDKGARAFYLEGGRIAISRQETTTELKKWWSDETTNRENAGVVKGTDEYSELYNAYLAKGKALAAKEDR